MAVDAGKNIIDGVTLSTSLATIYTVTNNLLRTKIDSITFTNFSASNASLTVQIVSSGSSAGNGKILISAKLIRAGESYTAPELTGQGIEEGGTLRASASSGTALNCTATGTIYS